MMPPPLHVYVMDSPALRTQNAVCTAKFAKSLATWQQRMTSIRIFCRILLPLSRVQFRPKCNVFNNESYLPKFHRNAFSIRAKPMLVRDIGTTGHMEIYTYI